MWAEFSSYQVRRTQIPRRRKVTGSSVDQESSSQPPQFVPHVKPNAAISASIESEHVDTYGIHRERFRQRNVHGHASDSSIATLLYGQSAPEIEPTADVVETGLITFQFLINVLFSSLTC